VIAKFKYIKVIEIKLILKWNSAIRIYLYRWGYFRLIYSLWIGSLVR